MQYSPIHAFLISGLLIIGMLSVFFRDMPSTPVPQEITLISTKKLSSSNLRVLSIQQKTQFSFLLILPGSVLFFALISTGIGTRY